jgi:4-alpha-glucanotransferase
MDKDTISFCKKFLDYDGEINEDFVWKFIKTAFASVGDTAIIQMQDYLMIGSDARMNIPSILGGNWQWRAGKRDFTKSLANKIADVTRTYGRCRR